MVDFIKFKDIFSSWSYTKEEIETRTTEEVDKVKYNNGRVFFKDETGVEFVKRKLPVYYQFPLNHQELHIIEEDYNYPISSLNYLYSDRLLHRVACHWDNEDWENVEEDYEDLFEDKEILLIVYDYTNGILNDLDEDFKEYIYNIYEISSGEYML